MDSGQLIPFLVGLSFGVIGTLILMGARISSIRQETSETIEYLNGRIRRMIEEQRTPAKKPRATKPKAL